MKKDVREETIEFRHSRAIGMNRLRVKEEASEETIIFHHIIVIDMNRMRNGCEYRV